MKSTFITTGALTAAAALMLSACSSGSGNGAGSGSEAEPDDGSITVFAAASLNQVFADLGESFEDETGTSVDFSFGGSSDLVAQMQAGAPADVFASANEKNMDKMTDEDLMEDQPQMFATNTLTIVTAPGNPTGVKDLHSLSADDISLVICAPEVPCGAATQEVAELAGVELSPVSEENAVTNVLGKVTSGQADAGLVYVTDATGAGDDVTAVDFPEAADVINNYPIGVLKSSKNSEAAGQWVDCVLSDTGRRALADAGFGSP